MREFTQQSTSQNEFCFVNVQYLIVQVILPSILDIRPLGRLLSVFESYIVFLSEPEATPI